MTALAALAVLWPLSRARAVKAAREADLAVYRDQLAEIGRDAKAGRLPPAEAEAARTEVARRMLAADAARETGAGEDPARSARRRRAAAVAALVFVPAFAASLYFALGSPAIPGAPLAERLTASPERSDLAIVVRKIEEHLARNPDDGQGYELLAPVYLSLGRPEDAARAYGETIRLRGPTALRYAARGEALVIAADGLVTAEAAKAFAEAIRLDPGEPGANYYLGLAAAQDGRDQDAARIWGELLARSPPDASYRADLQRALARIGRAPATPPPAAVQSPAAPGPGAADVAAAARMSQDDRNAMVRDMVARLADRLASEPHDIDGWLRLVRAYAVLGEKDKMADALRNARNAFKDDAAALGRLDDAEKALAAGGKG